jgi:PTH1 family peptidyl-tRNA hydrolase
MDLGMSHKPIKMVVGLGNPGAEHEQDRHNVGFWFVDELALRHNGNFKPERKFDGDCCRISIGGNELWLLKPSTYMNRSGLAVTRLAAYYKIDPQEILVVHDELDLDVGVARIKRGGGHGGHNGLRSVISHIGQEFYRLRLGIGRPGDKNDVIDFVLSRPALKEHDMLTKAVSDSADVMPLWLGEGDERAMHQLHSIGVEPRPHRRDTQGTLKD